MFAFVPLLVWWATGDWRDAWVAAKGYARAMGVILALGLILSAGGLVAMFLST
ncbi:MAG: hypothetical protein JWO33_1827 [Caulobacteraceae bacterium]|nr:hypothetical protein [Caulobacteraceae bacterium]